MIRPPGWCRRLLVTVGVTAGAAAWWWPISDWASDQGTYHAAGLFLGVVLTALSLNFLAWRRFSRMYRATLAAAWAGVAEPGAVVYSANQRLRYSARVVEDCWALLVAALAIVAVTHPQLAADPWYGKVILTFLFGTVIVTAWLTHRDLKTLRILRRIDAATDAAELRPIHWPGPSEP